MSLVIEITGLAQSIAADIKNIYKLVKPASVDLTDGATVSTNLSLGKSFRVTLGGNRTLANPTNANDGYEWTIAFKQDGIGGRTITLGSKYVIPTGATFTLATAAGSVSIAKFKYYQTEDKVAVLSLVQEFVL